MAQEHCDKQQSLKAILWAYELQGLKLARKNRERRYWTVSISLKGRIFIESAPCLESHWIAYLHQGDFMISCSICILHFSLHFTLAISVKETCWLVQDGVQNTLLTHLLTWWCCGSYVSAGCNRYNGKELSGPWVEENYVDFFSGQLQYLKMNCNA